MNDQPKSGVNINGKPASAYKYAFMVVQDYEDDIEVCKLPDGNIPKLENLIDVFETAARTIHTQLTIATIVNEVNKLIHQAMNSDVSKLLKKVNELEQQLQEQKAKDA